MSLKPGSFTLIPRLVALLLAAVSFTVLPSQLVGDATNSPMKTGDQFRDAFVDDPDRSGPLMAFIGPQDFIMGSRPDEPGFRATEIQHPVSVSSYSIGVFAVTNAEYCEFLNEVGNQDDEGILWVLTDRPNTCLIVEENGVFRPVEGAENRPVVTVSWTGAREYCRWLSRKTGRIYRLPTEAEWEAAARAGTDTIWPWGDEFDPEAVHWAGSYEFSGQTAPVGTYPPNPWGIHEMLGNTWEWVIDCTEDDFYFRSPTQDPVLFNDDCWTPGIRGGCYNDGPEWVRPGYRINTWWWGEYSQISFRVVREEGEHRRSRFERPQRPSQRRVEPEQ